MFMRWLKSRWVLGTALMRRVSLAPFLPEHGARPWLARLSREDLSGVPEGLWDYADQTSRCIGCGLCEVTGRLDEAPSSVIMAAAREPSITPLATETAARLEELAEAIARVCPARVPAGSVARLIRDNARRLEEERRLDRRS